MHRLAAAVAASLVASTSSQPALSDLKWTSDAYDEPLPSCSNATETYDCNAHPRAEFEGVSTINGINVTLAANGTLGVNVTDDESCLEGCLSCFGDAVQSGKFRIKQVGPTVNFGAEYYKCDCGFGDGQPVEEPLLGGTTEGRLYVDLCEDAGFDTSGAAGEAAGVSGLGVLGASALALAYGMI